MTYFSAEYDLEQGKDVSLPDMPQELAFYNYRKEFGLSWWEFVATPWNVLALDFEMMSVRSLVVSSKRRSAEKNAIAKQHRRQSNRRH